MALRQLRLSREAANLRSESERLTAAMQEIEARRAAWRERERRAEAALEEMTDETPEADRAAFEEECAEIQTEDEAITADENDNTTRQTEITGRLAEIDRELEELNQRARNPQAETAGAEHHNDNSRGGNVPMNNRENYTREMQVRERIRGVLQNETVRTFMAGVRSVMQNRGVNNANYLVPTEFLPIIRENIAQYSALLKHVNVRRLSGDGKQTVLGTIPEAVWTENTGKINELALSAAQISVAANKVAGFIPVANSYLEDADENLAAVVLDSIAQGIGFALDKAILYGTGKNMPVGIMTRLAATEAPSWWQSTAPAFVNLSASNIGKASTAGLEGEELYKEMAKTLGKAKPKYGTGSGKFWAMSGATWTQLQVELLTINAAGAIVTGAQQTMPIIGGAVEVIENIIEDGVVIGGYGSQYLLAERGAVELAQSEHARFTDDETLFRGKARYDGAPVAGEGFAAFSLSTNAPTTTKTFAEDKANAAG